MNYFKSILCLLFLCSLSFSSCKKYEEGPGVSFLSAKQRLTNEWSFSSVIENNQDVTADYQGAELVITKGGSCTFGYYEVENNVRHYFQDNGTWSFENNKSRLQFLFNRSNGSYTLNFDILKLKNNELHLRTEDQFMDWVLVSSSRR